MARTDRIERRREELKETFVPSRWPREMREHERRIEPPLFPHSYLLVNRNGVSFIFLIVEDRPRGTRLFSSTRLTSPLWGIRRRRRRVYGASAALS